MRKFKDLTGMKFGRLTVIKATCEGESGKHAEWLCKCDCGNEKIVRSSNLTVGRVKSCGCLIKESGKFTKDLKGKRFGRLKVMKKSTKNKKGYMEWLCKCDCGNEITVSSTKLMQGMTKSCGCLSIEHIKNIQLLGCNSGRYKGTRISQLSKKTPKNNTTGIKGVTFNKRRNKYISQIEFKGKHIYLGGFDDLKDAAKARKEGEEKYFKPIIREYESLNRNKEQNCERENE